MQEYGVFLFGEIQFDKPERMDLVQKRMRSFLLTQFICGLFLAAFTRDGLADWWNEAYSYRVPIKVYAGGYARFEKPVELDVNFTALFQQAGIKAVLDESSIRVVETDENGNALDAAVPCQFDRAEDFHPMTNAAGEVILLLKGTTAANQKPRYFYIYFGELGGVYSSPSVTPLVRFAGIVEHEGQASYKIETSSATYYYHRRGAGFASLEDRDGYDWLSYNPGVGKESGSGSGGKYRGTPNMGHPEGYCHPGNTVSNSWLVEKGPLKVSILSQSNDGKMQCLWDIFPQYVRQTVLKMRTPYWFLYEGTPGGRLDEESDFCVRSVGGRLVKTLANEKWDGDIAKQDGPGEWIYFGDGDRILYFIHHKDDDAVDSYWPMNHEMTVFGFGRKGIDKFMNDAPARFTFGLHDGASFDSATAMINSAYQETPVLVGMVEGKF